MTDRILTNSELRTFQLCKRKWMLAYVNELVPRPGMESAAGVMNLGSSIHFALEAYYGHETDPFVALKWVYDSVIADHPLEADELEKEFMLAKIMLEGYLDWVNAEGIDAAVDIIGTEVPVQHPLTIPGTHDVVMLRGRFDQLARRKSDGAIIVRDLKTVGGLGKAQMLRIASQLKFYTLVQSLQAKDRGEPAAAGGEYLLLLRSKRTDRASPPFYAKVEVPINRHDLNNQYLMTVSLAGEIEDARRRLAAGEDHHKVAYPHFGDWCSWGCDFKNVCPLMDDGSRWQDMIAADFIRRDSLSYYSDDKMKALKSMLADQ